MALDTGDTAWILTATALVLFMTIPGLSLFYGGLVRSKNVLSVLMQCFAITCAVSLVWLICGYSLAFSDGGSLNAWIGGLDHAFFAGIGKDTLERHAAQEPARPVPDDLRYHYPGPDRGGVCRAHAFRTHAGVFRPLAAGCLCARVSLGMGRRLAGRAGSV